MDATPRPLTTRETLLLVIHAAGDRVDGRTVMQKLAYFTGLGLETSLGHRAHFYGPYSAKVEDALNNAVLAGEVTEVVERMPHWSGGPDLQRYTYDLAGPGTSRVESLVASHETEWSRIDQSVTAIIHVLPGLDQKTLSSAAKTYLIIAESDGGVDQEDIPDLAERLGWTLDATQVETTVRLLAELDLLEAD